MKRLVAELPTLTTSMKDNELMVYLSIADEAVCVVLLVERNRRKMPIHYVSWSLQGAKADALSKLAAVQCNGLTNGVLVEELNEKSVDIAEINMVVEEEGRTWMTSITEYMEIGILLNDPTEERTIREKITSGKLKYLIVVIDYFTKCLEAKPMASITGKQVKSFAFDNIVYMFGVPATIITGNGTQLINEAFKSLVEGLEIKVISMSVHYPKQTEQ
nr:Pol polyprotein [Tanacetum cinerariifolium]